MLALCRDEMGLKWNIRRPNLVLVGRQPGASLEKAFWRLL